MQHWFKMYLISTTTITFITTCCYCYFATAAYLIMPLSGYKECVLVGRCFKPHEFSVVIDNAALVQHVSYFHHHHLLLQQLVAIVPSQPLPISSCPFHGIKSVWWCIGSSKVMNLVLLLAMQDWFKRYLISTTTIFFSTTCIRYLAATAAYLTTPFSQNKECVVMYRWLECHEFSVAISKARLVQRYILSTAIIIVNTSCCYCSFTTATYLIMPFS